MRARKRNKLKCSILADKEILEFSFSKNEMLQDLNDLSLEFQVFWPWNIRLKPCLHGTN